VTVVELPGTDAFAEKVWTLLTPEVLGSDRRVREYGAELYDLLLGPLAGRLKGKDLVLVPDGVLCRLPFELLVAGGRYLAETRRLRYAPSLTALHLARQWQRARTPPTRPLFAVGDPVFGPDDDRLTGQPPRLASRRGDLEDLGFREARPDKISFDRLRHSGREVEAIAALLGAEKEDLLLGFDATLEGLRRPPGRLGRARYVHLATHGVLGAGDGQQPALVLGLPRGAAAGTGAAPEQLLRLDEVAGLRLSADLVVLSACRTGQGRLDAAEGVSGLARAFLAAGSRGVVCSLWAVDDAATAGLMTRLYRGLQKGQPTAEALGEARRALIAAGRPPRLWAPFILQGE
jgi:CHAT domain-containing protein